MKRLLNFVRQYHLLIRTGYYILLSFFVFGIIAGTFLLNQANSNYFTKMKIEITSVSYAMKVKDILRMSVSTTLLYMILSLTLLGIFLFPFFILGEGVRYACLISLLLQQLGRRIGTIFVYTVLLIPSTLYLWIILEYVNISFHFWHHVIQKKRIILKDITIFVVKYLAGTGGVIASYFLQILLANWFTVFYK